MNPLGKERRGHRTLLFLVLLALMSMLLLYYYILPAAVNVTSTQCKLSEDQASTYTSKPHAKWIVTRSTSSLDTARLSGWKILVYDTHTIQNNNCTPPVCTYLKDELRRNIHLKFPASLSSEMTAYLVAVSHGASYIYVVDQWREGMEELLARFSFRELTSGLIAKTTLTEIDVKTIFSEGPSLRRKYATLTYPPYYLYFDYILREDLHPLVQCSVPSGNGNRLNLNQHSHVINDPPPVFLPINTFASLDFEQALFHYDAFWALGLKQVPFGNLIAQKLLWEFDSWIGVYPRSLTDSIQHKFAFNHDYLFNNPSFMDILKHATCEKSLNFLQCIHYITTLLKEKRVISKDSADIVIMWTTILRNIQYQTPKRLIKKEERNSRIVSPPFINGGETIGLFLPSKMYVKEDNVALKTLQTVCPQGNLPTPASIITDIALIISFNFKKLFKNIPLLEAMYRPYFRHIVFCGPTLQQFRLFAANSTIGPFIFIEAFKGAWYFLFDCTIEAMKLNLNVRGFLQIGDDTILNPWSLNGLPRDRIWLNDGFRYGNTSSEELDPPWMWWTSGKRTINNFFTELQSNQKYHLRSDLEAEFLEIYKANSKNYTRLYVHACDFMYMPVKFKDGFIKMGSLAIKHGIMVEIAFVNIALGLQLLEDMYVVEDGHLWGDNRQNNTKLYRRDMLFMHPFKLGLELLPVRKRGRQMFCNKYIEDEKT